MACRLYKGVRIGTFLYQSANDPMTKGISARNSLAAVSTGSIEMHIARGTTTSPFVSLSKSFGVARNYAIEGSLTRPSSSSPAYVYEIDVPDLLPAA